MLTGKNLSLELGNRDVFSDVDISVPKRSKIGLVGPNGAGKTSLLRILGGELEPTSGVVVSHDVEVGIVPQDMRPYAETTVRDFVEVATGVRGVQDDYDDAYASYEKEPEDMDTLVRLTESAERLGYYDVDSFDATLMNALNRAGLDDAMSERQIGSLSGGQRTRVALAAVMADKRYVILLDEPTNNLDMPGIELLEQFIQGSPAAFLMVSHDRRFLQNAATSIVELLGGDRGTNQYKLGYEEYVEARARALIDARNHYEQHELARKALVGAARDARVRANSAEGGGSRRKDNDKLTANHRAGRAAGHLSGAARSLESRIDQHDSAAPSRPQEPVSLDFLFNRVETTKGQTLVNVDALSVQYEDSDETFGPYSFKIKGGDRVAITGANGTGKSTVLKAIMGQLNANDVEGGHFINPSATVAYIDQNQTIPLPEGTPLDNLMALAPGIDLSDAMHLLIKFNLNRDTLNTMEAQKLSGGERAKILLAAVAAQKANLLILDEPTNNLDIPTIDALQAAIETYQGAILVVSHDREFIEGIGVTDTIKL